MDGVKMDMLLRGLKEKKDTCARPEQVTTTHILQAILANQGTVGYVTIPGRSSP